VNEASEGELAAFTAYGCAFPNKFLCLVDTYDVLRYVTFQAASQYVDAAYCYTIVSPAKTAEPIEMLFGF